MARKKPAVLLSEKELQARIDRIVAIRPVANEYRLLMAEIKEDLLARRQDEFQTVAGNRAVITRRTAKAWLVDKLQRVLPGNVFDVLCPRKPDAKKLNQRLAATPEDKGLAGCRIDVPGAKVELEILAAGEVLAAPEADAEEAA